MENVRFTLDRRDDGEWLVWDKADNVKHPAGSHKPRVVALIEQLNEAHRPNVEASADGIMICWNNHEKGDSCEYELFPRVPPNV